MEHEPKEEKEEGVADNRNAPCGKCKKPKAGSDIVSGVILTDDQLCQCGRPTKQEVINQHISEAMRKGNEEKVLRLKDAARVGAPPVEQYYYAGISKATYYRWLQENSELKDDLDTLENGHLRLAARQNVATKIQSGDVDLSWAYLKSTDEKMSKTRMAVEHSGEIKGSDALYSKLDEVRKKSQEEMKALIDKDWDDNPEEETNENREQTPA